MKIQLVSFVVYGLLGFASKAIKLLLTELVGQCKNILPLAFSTLKRLRAIYSCTDLPLVSKSIVLFSLSIRPSKLSNKVLHTKFDLQYFVKEMFN